MLHHKLFIFFIYEKLNTEYFIKFSEFLPEYCYDCSASWFKKLMKQELKMP